MKWIHKVTSVSTFPPKGTFTKKAKDIADIMAKPEVSPKGLGSAIKMVQYFINRGGKGISKKQKGELEEAKKILQEMKKEQDRPQPQG